MCKHTHQMNGKTHSCRWGAYILALAPNDPEFILAEDNAGYCLFHSRDLDWKRQKGFVESFMALSLYLNEDKSEEQLEFHDFHFVGWEEDEDNLGAHFDFNILFALTVISKDILLYDSTFYDHLYLERMIFRGDVTLINCTFQKQVHLNRCVFGESLDVSDSTFLDQLHTHHSNHFHVNLIFSDCNFSNVFDLENITCSAALIIEGNQFIGKESSFSLIGDFKGGIFIRHNKTPGFFSIEESTFYSESQIYGVNRESDFQLRYCRIYGTLLLEGDEENLLFGPNSTLELDSMSFGENGRIIFSWCDLLNLNQDFLHRVKDFEQNEKVIINATCKIDRLRLVYEYPYNDVNEFVMEDMYRIITRYFRHLHIINLNVEIIRKRTKRRMQIIYTTRESITQQVFFKRLETTIHYVFSNRPLPQGKFAITDLIVQRDALAQRMHLQLQQGSLNREEIIKQLSHEGQININLNLITNKNEYIMEKHENNQKSVNIFGKSTQTITNIFKGNRKSNTELLFAEATKEVEEYADFNDKERTQILEMLIELKSKVDKDETIPSFLKDSLLSTAGSLASIGSLLQGIG